MRIHSGRGRRTVDVHSARFVLLVSVVLLAVTGAVAPTTRTIDIVGDAFRPVELAAQRGDTITWRNTDMVAHTVTSQRTEFESGRIEPGKHFIWIASDTGVFAYYCQRHRAMRATLIVR